MSNGDYRFLLWELIFGRPSVGRYTPLFNADFTDSCFDHSYSIPNLRTHIWQIQVLADLLPTSNGNFTDCCSELIFHYYSQNSYFALQVLADLPPIKWQFHRLLLWQLIFHYYSQNSYLAHADVHRSSPALTCSYCRFLLWELIFGWPNVGRSTPLFNADFTDSCFDHSYSIPNLRTHIWQTRCWQIYPPSNGNFTDCCSDSSYFIPTLRTHIWHTRCWQI